jgi:aerobic-type carbon monoxide dehydrogenase small subunit (CoxS/CutS family)
VIAVNITVNGSTREIAVEPRTTLAELLRGGLGLTGTKLGCEHGVCGSCTVLLDGAPVRSCLILGVQTDGRTVTTVEGLSERGELNELQESFRRNHALQCGFCTAGFLITATSLLAEGAVTDEASVREGLAGNICRCTGYEPIVAAVLEVAAR